MTADYQFRNIYPAVNVSLRTNANLQQGVPMCPSSSGRLTPRLAGFAIQRVRQPPSMNCLGRFAVTAGKASRSLSTCRNPSHEYLKHQELNHSSGSYSTTPSGLSDAQQASLDSAIRVDQAGEVAANWIYRGQMAVLGRDREAGPVIQVSCSHRVAFITEQVSNQEYVGPREKASCCDEYAPIAT
jgi:Ubiquinone biosynthesis protein COQ7